MRQQILTQPNQYVKSPYFTERNLSIYKDHVRGMSYSKIALKYNVTPSRVGQIIKRFKEEKS